MDYAQDILQKNAVLQTAAWKSLSIIAFSHREHIDCDELLFNEYSSRIYWLVNAENRKFSMKMTYAISNIMTQWCDPRQLINIFVYTI